ncbi:hypothetical protein AcW1_003881 [Taiwanofungus camphoratus]|nr:hypothetical protein AcW1_003881 [Antrodia cinnamomea]
MREGEVTYKLPDLIAVIQAESQYLLLCRALHHGGVEVREPVSPLCDGHRPVGQTPKLGFIGFLVFKHSSPGEKWTASSATYTNSPSSGTRQCQSSTPSVILANAPV